MRRQPARRLRPMPDELTTPPIRDSDLDIRARLDRLKRLNRRGRFSQLVDLKLLAIDWANDYVSHVFPNVSGTETNQLLLAAEASFMAAIEMGKTGIREWGRLLEEGKNARGDFSIK